MRMMTLTLAVASAALAAGAFGAPTLAAAQSRADTKFLMDAMEGDLGEIQLGQLAVQKGGSQEVKDFGQRLVDDHTKALDQVRPVAETHGVKIPTEPKSDARQELAKLQKLDGAAFDKEFVRHMVQDHRKDVAEFQKEAKNQGDASNLAQQQLPVLQAHLQTAEQLEAKVAR